MSAADDTPMPPAVAVKFVNNPDGTGEVVATFHLEAIAGPFAVGNFREKGGARTAALVALLKNTEVQFKQALQAMGFQP